ncbi:hypothetical protein C809_03022 [Lachnospiraceae bacterium MD335]|nr:hypothetical protein C809_03022 [Lachnospiraceae bacterium MD335]
MKKKIIESIVICNDDSNNDWSFDTKDDSLSSGICSAIDEILDRQTQAGEKFTITIEKI